jgi:hypothetical protein
MATKQQALKAIQAVGVKLDEQIADCGTYILDAPEGKIFEANGEPSYLAGVYDREDARIGFGPKMFGWTDRHGVDWAVRWIP